jgi:hypothetical protein
MTYTGLKQKILLSEKKSVTFKADMYCTQLSFLNLIRMPAKKEFAGTLKEAGKLMNITGAPCLLLCRQKKLSNNFPDKLPGFEMMIEFIGPRPYPGMQ